MGERLAVTVPDAREPSRPLTRLHRMAKSGRTPHPIFGVPYSVEVVQICLQLEFCAARKKDRREVDFSSSLL
jgi:hypothetical protein